MRRCPKCHKPVDERQDVLANGGVVCDICGMIYPVHFNPFACFETVEGMVGDVWSGFDNLCRMIENKEKYDFENKRWNE